jgi:hypothetical protein
MPLDPAGVKFKHTDRSEMVRMLPNVGNGVSKSYRFLSAYYLRDNPLVETRQFFAEVNSEKFEMLHAKQMVVVLRDPSRNWAKYVKFGGSYNPAGRAQNMWEINATSVNG